MNGRRDSKNAKYDLRQISVTHLNFSSILLGWNLQLRTYNWG
jgi:hypothetical protein